MPPRSTAPDFYAARVRGLPLLDQLMANSWRPVAEETRGGWRYRWAHGVTRRANSALASGHASIVELVDHAEAFYRQRGAPPLVHVSTASAPRDLAVHLSERGYRSTARTLVQDASTADVVERTEPSFGIEVTDMPTEQWFRAYWSVESARGRSEADVDVVRDVLLAPDLPTVFAAVLDGDEVVGVGQSVIERGWAGVQCMATARRHRRRGVASAALNGLARDAAQRGVARLYLAVMADNESARRLYEGAGFAATHEYSYFAPERRR